MRRYSDLLSTALAAAALAAAVLFSPWLTRTLQSPGEAGPPPALQASQAAHPDPCAAHSTTCAAQQRDRANGVVTAGADKTF
jgi:hypothetical protein